VGHAGTLAAAAAAAAAAASCQGVVSSCACAHALHQARVRCVRDLRACLCRLHCSCAEAGRAVSGALFSVLRPEGRSHHVQASHRQHLGLGWIRALQRCCMGVALHGRCSVAALQLVPVAHYTELLHWCGLACAVVRNGWIDALSAVCHLLCCDACPAAVTGLLHSLLSC
jgi:hypothetical protein